MPRAPLAAVCPDPVLMSSIVLRALTGALLSVLAPLSVAAQSIEDGFPVERRQLRLAADYGVDRWDQYWEGSLKRTNANLGTVRTQMTTLGVGYGVTRSIALFAAVPWVATRASQGVLAGQRGAQDLTLAAKWRVLETPLTSRGAVSAFAVGVVGGPVTDYSPDFLPLSIGLGARRATLRGTVHYQDRSGLFVDAAVAHTWRSTVTLDRPAYYTNGQLVLSNEVFMPNVVDYAATIGLAAGPLCLPITFSDQRTMGGGDIRRQDMPFVSNRMNQQRVHAQVMVDLPFLRALRVTTGLVRVLHGRNVGQGTQFTGGVIYSFGPLRGGSR